MTISFPYDTYVGKVFGGWIGKSIGGTIGARFEGNKHWTELDPDKLFPETIPPNDDLDLQVLWLKVLEEKGMNLASDDLAEAWLEWCWYPFCEYGVFRRNWRLGIRPPMSGRFTNQRWETGMGCPIRSEIWGYAFPGRPALAAEFAAKDGALDHAEQSIGAEQMFAAMAADAFFEEDLIKLVRKYMAYLPPNSPVEQGVRAALEAFDEGLSLRDARERLILRHGVPEACDARINVPFTILALLYGKGDLLETVLTAVRCGYDTDCTAATACALVGQVLGVKGIPRKLIEAVGDELVMGIRYARPEATLSALARDTARMGVLLADANAVRIEDAPPLAPLPAPAVAKPSPRIIVSYGALPAARSGRRGSGIGVHRTLQGECEGLGVGHAPGWEVTPANANPTTNGAAHFDLHAPRTGAQWPLRNLFHVRHAGASVSSTFGVAGAGLWYLLGAFYDLETQEKDMPHPQQRAWHQHFAYLNRNYLDEPVGDPRPLWEACSRRLGAPATLASYEHEVDLDRLLGLRGTYCAYLTRQVVAAKTHGCHIVIGNTDAFRSMSTANASASATSTSGGRRRTTRIS